MRDASEPRTPSPSCCKPVWKLLDEVTRRCLLRHAVHWPAVPKLKPDSCTYHRCDPKHLPCVMAWAALQAGCGFTSQALGSSLVPRPPKDLPASHATERFVPGSRPHRPAKRLWGPRWRGSPGCGRTVSMASPRELGFFGRATATNSGRQDPGYSV